MENSVHLILSQADFQKLSTLLRSANTEIADLLADELNRAVVVADEQLPDDVVSMNSKVCFRDIATGSEKVVTLVYPNEANIEENKISVLAPMGSALIGLRVGQMIQWPLPNGRKKEISVVSVLSQAKSA